MRSVILSADRTFHFKAAATLAAAATLSVSLNAQAAESWTDQGGCAISVAVGWAIGCVKVNSAGNGIYAWNGTGWWTPAPSSDAETIITDANGSPWVIDLSHIIYNSIDGATDFVVFDSSKAWKSVAVGNPAVPYNIWAVDTSRNIWANSGTFSSPGTWVQAHGTADKVVLSYAPQNTCPRVSVLNETTAGAYDYPTNAATCAVGVPTARPALPNNGTTKDITPGLSLSSDGNTYSYGGAAPWALFAGATPTGTTALAAGGNSGEIYAIDKAHGNIYSAPPPASLAVDLTWWQTGFAVCIAGSGFSPGVVSTAVITNVPWNGGLFTQQIGGYVNAFGNPIDFDNAFIPTDGNPPCTQAQLNDTTTISVYDQITGANVQETIPTRNWCPNGNFSDWGPASCPASGMPFPLP